MKKKCFSVLFLIFVTSTYGETYTLAYRPVENIAYYYNYSVSPSTQSKSPLLFNVSDVKRNDNIFKYNVNYITSETPPKDIDLFATITMDSMGNAGFWKMKNIEQKPLIRKSINIPSASFYSVDDEEFIKIQNTEKKKLNSDLIFLMPVLFPYFDKNKHEIGDEWEMNIPAPIEYFKDTISDKAKIRHIVKAQQKFKEITSKLGLECAKIEYSIYDTLTRESEETIYLRCIGVVYFAINEGFIVNDVMRIEYKSKEPAYNSIYTRKLRMVRYK